MSALPVGLKEIRSRATGALEKASPLGPDIDLSLYCPAGVSAPPAGTAETEEDIGEAALGAGVDLTERNRAGTYLQLDGSVLCSRTAGEFGDQVEILPIDEALSRYRSVREKWWGLVEPDADKYTAFAALHPSGGYFIRILPGKKVARPVQSCLLLGGSGTAQNVHNVIVAEEGSEAHIITGCTIRPGAEEGLHVGVSEFIIGRGASLTFTMVHNWSDGFHVRPRSSALVGAGGTFVSNYILMRPVGSIQMYPTTVLEGSGARGRFQAILFGRKDSVLDIGSRTVLRGRGSGSEAVSRAIASERSTILARGRLVALTSECRAHLECRGMLTSRQAVVRAVPELEADGVPRADLSHEAAISPIAEEEVAYLMSRGLRRDEALSTITRGFLNVELLGLPRTLERAVDSILASTPCEGGGL